MQDRKIILLEATPEKKIVLGKNYSNRVSALAPSSVELLTKLGAWDLIKDVRMGRVVEMKVWDSCSTAAIQFGDKDNQKLLNYIVENDLTVKALTEVLSVCDNVEVKYNAKVKQYHLPNKDEKESRPKEEVLVELEGGEIISTQLLVGADGFRSLVRSSIGCDYVGWEYDQMGLVATLNVEIHDNINNTAWQRFLPTGPVALLPLSNNHSSLVWTVGRNMAKKMIEMDEATFINKLNMALTGKHEEDHLVETVSKGFELILNSFTPTQKQGNFVPLVTGVENRAAFPLGFGHSTRYVGPRTLLIGDAAHRVHPLAGQGVNLGYGDVAALTRLMEASILDGAGLGHHDYLR